MGDNAELCGLNCHSCGYDLRGSDCDGICPECGLAISETKRLLNIQDRAKHDTASIMVYYACGWIAMAGDGWVMKVIGSSTVVFASVSVILRAHASSRQRRILTAVYSVMSLILLFYMGVSLSARYGILPRIVEVVTAVFVFAFVWQLTSLLLDSIGKRSHRLLVRQLKIAQVASSLFSAIFVLVGKSISSGNAAAIDNALVVSISGVAGWTLWLFAFATYHLFREADSSTANSVRGDKS